MPGIASAATSVVIGYVAGGTRTIRVGSGGVMLPNHTPLVIAEQFGTLASLFPGRIDLGLGRAPGTDTLTARALRRDLMTSADRFPQDVQELQSYFRASGPGQKVRAIPGAGLNVPLWLLGSSLFSAQLAAQLGLPFAFASHFAPDDMYQALDLYRGQFQASEQLDRPYVMLGINVIAASTDVQARRYFTSLQQAFLNLRRGMPGRIPPPVDDINDSMFSQTGKSVDRSFAVLCDRRIGGDGRPGAGRLLSQATRPDELMMTANVYEHANRLRSLEMISGIRKGQI